MPEESLTALAYKAGFHNLHGISAWSHSLMGAVKSDEFEIIYFRELGDSRIELFCVRDSADPETCALHTVMRDTDIGVNLQENPQGRTGIVIDKRTPRYAGRTAVGIMEVYASEAKEEPVAYRNWVDRANRRP